MINEVINLICEVSVLAFTMTCLPEALLTPQNEGVNVDLGWGVNNHTSPPLFLNPPIRYNHFPCYSTHPVDIITFLVSQPTQSI